MVSKEFFINVTFRGWLEQVLEYLLTYMSKVLFICKKRQTEYGVSYGLINSCRFLCNALEELGIEGKVASVIDNNCIDKEVHQYKPTHVFIEALWVVPEKFRVLIPLYPNIKWYVRLHSNTPFLANEGVAMEWINGYENIRKEYGNLWITPNSEKLVNDLWKSKGINTIYAPNVYSLDKGSPIPYTKVPIEHNSGIVNIGCFGAIRPMKNTLIQAMAAMAFANNIGKKLHFHINGRCEQNGENLHRNLIHLFKDTQHRLVEHPWAEHQEFRGLVKEMDLGMQISFSETFNIVAADMVMGNVPLVGSHEIHWLSAPYKAGTTNLNDIVFHLTLAYYSKKINLHWLNKVGLEFYNYKSLTAWINLLS